MARPPASPTRPIPAPRRRGRWRAFFTWSFIAFFAALLLLVGIVFAQSASLPSYEQLTRRSELGKVIRVRSADGRLLVALGPSLGNWVPYAEIPPAMRSAMIAVEDQRFRQHPGVDPIAIARIVKFAIVNRGSGRRLQGGSTITQQLARNIFLTNNYTVARKLREMVMALALERKFSKNQILELYLNRVYFGGGAYGIDAASRTFFGHDARRLSLGEAAIIAGLVKAPSNYSPTADVEAARGRAGVVLQTMVANGFISAAAAENVDPARIVVQPTQKQNSIRYFTDWALPQLDTLIGDTTEPIDVWTTLDTSLQASGDRAINANVPNGAQGALVSLDQDGAVRAMIGGRDYVSSLYNRATQAQRQPGSAFKLFVYLSALESGMKPTSVLVDEPVEIQGWRPRNSTRTNLGPVTLREAFARSINTISAKIGAQLGFSTIADMAQRFGITGKISTNPSMVLGTSNVRLLDMTRAYAAVSNKGVSVMPYGITKVATTDGQLLYRHERSDDRVLVAPWVAAQMTDLLQTAVLSGTGRAAQIGRPVAGKTGTTQSNKDGWFIGFSSGITTGVWMGRDDNRPIPGLQGGTAPAQAFHDFMVTAVAKRPIVAFETEVPMPDWQLEPGEELPGASILGDAPLVDADGNPIGAAPSAPIGPAAGDEVGRAGGTPDQSELDRIFNGGPPPIQQQPPRQPPPEPESDPSADPAEFRPDPA